MVGFTFYVFCHSVMLIHSLHVHTYIQCHAYLFHSVVGIYTYRTHTYPSIFHLPLTYIVHVNTHKYTEYVPAPMEKG